MVAAVNIVVEPLNDRPVAVNDEFTLGEGDGALAIVAPGGVMANDTDIDGDTLTTSLVSGPAHGTLSLNPDGTFNYTPEDGFEGDDSFRYQAFDGKANSNVATVTLHVEDGPTQSPTLPVAADDSFTMNAGETLTISAPGVLGNDTDPESDVLSATMVAGPANGVLTLNADGSFAYTPSVSFSGTDSFTYQASDGVGTSNTATVTIAVEAGEENLRPEAVNDSFTVESGVALNVDAAGGLLGNDSDPEGASLTASLFTGPLHGTVSLAADGSFNYTSDDDYVGLDSFLYRVSDGTLWSALAAVTIHVTPSTEPAPVPTPTPTPTPEPNPCLTIDQADDLLDALASDDNTDADAIDSIFANGNWLA
jgi:VCBS repeat-containing protein